MVDPIDELYAITDLYNRQSDSNQEIPASYYILRPQLNLTNDEDWVAKVENFLYMRSVVLLTRIIRTRTRFFGSSLGVITYPWTQICKPEETGWLPKDLSRQKPDPEYYHKKREEEKRKQRELADLTDKQIKILTKKLDELRKTLLQWRE